MKALNLEKLIFLQLFKKCQTFYFGRSHSVVFCNNIVIYLVNDTTYVYIYTGLFKMIVGVLTTFHTHTHTHTHTWDSSICVFLFNRTTLQVFVTYLTAVLYVHPLWFYKHQHENRVRSKLFVARLHVAFSLPFAAILINCAPSGEMHNYCTPHIIKENFENFLIHRCNYILLSQVYCVWQVVKTPMIILNNPAYIHIYIYIGNQY